MFRVLLLPSSSFILLLLQQQSFSVSSSCEKKNFFFFSAARADQTLRRSHHSQEEWKERKGKYHHPHNFFPFILRCKINVSRKYFLFRVKISFKIRTKIFSNYDEWVKTFPNNSCQRGKWVFYSEFSHMNEHGGRARKFFFRYVLASWQEVASVRWSVCPSVRHAVTELNYWKMGVSGRIWAK